MSAVIISEGHIIPEIIIQKYMIKGVLGSVERGRCVIISAKDPHLQERILRNALIYYLFLGQIPAFI